MSYYEMLYIVSPSLSDEERDSLIAKLRDFIEKNNGIIESENKWGLRSLAYPIKHQSKGYYVLTYLELSEKSVKDLKYFFKVNEGFLRVMILKTNKKLAATVPEVKNEKEAEENV
jgi:small subunit ribosomal protein S6